jgi:hypothetical protein
LRFLEVFRDCLVLNWLSREDFCFVKFNTNNAAKAAVVMMSKSDALELAQISCFVPKKQKCHRDRFRNGTFFVLESYA